MIDINCNILPGMGRGSKSLTESIKMAQIAVQQGITHIIATPQHQHGDSETSAENIIGAVDYLSGKLIEENIPLIVLPGQNIRIYGDMVHGLQHGDLLPLNRTSKYVLIELPESSVPNYVTQLQFDMQIAGYKPIIVHPESNQQIVDNPDELYRLVKNGALTQLAANSIVGRSGKKVQKFANQMIEANLAHFIASETTRGHKKSYLLKEAYDTIKKTYGSSLVYQFMERSQSVIDDLTIPKDQPYRIKAKKGLFR